MIAKVALFLVAVAVIDAAVVAPGLLNAGILTPGAVIQSVVAIPGAVSTDSRIIGTGLVGASPLLLNGGIIGLNGGILAPGAIWKK
ncbi:hypothetical protein AVEN_245395-1 [Araneus ventricosus]|uniref:Uncharacterized protein n=1 Tax=Araneus ventricosus TaxID=182803 RepID=A0A4Y2UXZ9_ARAVE|nr:hypothetical protein AVEN_245395-1 [Araneus ventricosus]